MGFMSLSLFFMQEYAYEQFLKRGKLLPNKLFEQEYKKPGLESSLKIR